MAAVQSRHAVPQHESTHQLAASDPIDDKTLYTHLQDDIPHDYSAPKSPSKRAKRKSQEESLIGTICAAIVDHQIGISVNLMLLLFLCHISFPRARRRTRTFFELSYYDSQTGLYTQGWDDVPFIAFWIVVFTGLRVFVMDYILMPAAQMGGVHKKRSRVRFAEQGWLLLYYCVFWTLGMYIMYNSGYWFNLRALWADFPTRGMSGLTKWYYLVQFAFWIQQILVVNIEEKRHDYAQMFTHHIITCTLVGMSYGFYQTKVGNAILCTMDVVDIFLPAAKLLKYMKYQTACDATFVVFIVSWFVARHVFYLAICWSIYVHVPTTMFYGCYDSATSSKLTNSTDPATSSLYETGGTEIWPWITQSFNDPGGIVCFNKRIQYSFLGLLLALQVLTLMWFVMIMKVAYRVIMGQPADDSRSDDEGCDGEEDELEDIDIEQHKLSAPQAIEEEVGVEGLHFVRRGSPVVNGGVGVGVGVKSKRRSGQRANGGSRSSGISIPGHGDHKELLGRIGCDKPS